MGKTGLTLRFSLYSESMLANEIIEQSYIDSKTNREDLFPEGYTEPQKDVWLGEKIDEIASYFYYEIGRGIDEGVNILREEFDLTPAARLRIGSGILIRRLYVGFSIQDGIVERRRAESRSAEDYENTQQKDYNKFAPEFTIIDNDVIIRPAPDEEVEKGVLMHFVPAYPKLSTEEKNYGTEDNPDEHVIPNLSDPILGIPEQFHYMLVKGMNSRILLVKGETTRSQEQGAMFTNEVAVAIKQMKQRSGRVKFANNQLSRNVPIYQ